MERFMNEQTEKNELHVNYNTFQTLLSSTVHREVEKLTFFFKASFLHK